MLAIFFKKRENSIVLRTRTVTKTCSAIRKLVHLILVFMLKVEKLIGYILCDGAAFALIDTSKLMGISKEKLD